MSIDIIQNEYRPPLSLSLYLQIRYRFLLHYWDPLNPPTTPSRCDIIYSFFARSIINPTMLSIQYHSAGRNNQNTHTSLSFLTKYRYRLFYFESNRSIRRHQHQQQQNNSFDNNIIFGFSFRSEIFCEH